MSRDASHLCDYARGIKAKQLDKGIDDTFVSIVRVEVSFSLIDFHYRLDGEKQYVTGMKG
jgi:hypothetical protein